MQRLDSPTLSTGRALRPCERLVWRQITLTPIGRFFPASQRTQRHPSAKVSLSRKKGQARVEERLGGSTLWVALFLSEQVEWEGILGSIARKKGGRHCSESLDVGQDGESLKRALLQQREAESRGKELHKTPPLWGGLAREETMLSAGKGSVLGSSFEPEEATDATNKQI